MLLTDHLEELRRRIIICILCTVFFSTISLIFADKILYILKLPSKNLINSFLILKPTESVTIYIKTALFSGLFLSAPIIFFHILKFIEPALEIQGCKNKTFALKWLFISFGLFLVGIIFVYFTVLPRAISFLIALSKNLINSDIAISLSSYISFVIAILFCGGLIFQIPLASFILTKAGILSPSFLMSKRKESYFALIVFAAIITPTTDIFSLTLFAVPMIILYEIGILFSKRSYKKKFDYVKSNL